MSAALRAISDLRERGFVVLEGPEVLLRATPESTVEDLLGTGEAYRYVSRLRRQLHPDPLKRLGESMREAQVGATVVQHVLAAVARKKVENCTDRPWQLRREDVAWIEGVADRLVGGLARVRRGRRRPSHDAWVRFLMAVAVALETWGDGSGTFAATWLTLEASAGRSVENMIVLVTEGKPGCLMAILKVMSPGDHQRGRSTVWRADAGMLLAPRQPKKARKKEKASRPGADGGVPEDVGPKPKRTTEEPKKAETATPKSTWGKIEVIVRQED